VGDQRPPQNPSGKSGRVHALRKFFHHAKHGVSGFIDEGWKVLSALGRAVIILLVCAAIILTIQQVLHARLVIEPIIVPKQLEDSGITAEVMSNRIRDALDRIEATAGTNIREESSESRTSTPRFVVPSDQTPYASVEIPGTKFDLNSVVQLILSVLQFHQPDTVSGEVTLPGPAKPAGDGPASPAVAANGGRITLRIRRSAGTVEQVTLLHDSNDLDASVEEASEELLKEEDPYPLGLYWLSQGKPDSAIEIAQRMSLGGKPDKAHQIAALNLWGTGLKDKKQYEDAIKMFQKVLDGLDRNSVTAYTGLGIAYFDEGHADKAIENFQMAVNLSQKSPAAHVNLANALSSLGQFDKANAEYVMANKLDSSSVKTYIDWAISLSDQKEYSEAEDKFQQAKLLDPNNAELYIRWGNSLSDQHEYPPADEKFQQAKLLDPNNAELYIRWGNSLSDRKNFTGASATYTKAIELNPENDEAHNDLGVALYYQHKYTEAVDQYKKAIELLKIKPVKNYVEPYLNWGALLLYQHQYPEAIAKFMEALQLAPDNADAKNYWGRALSGLHKYEEAIAKFKEVSDKDSKNSEAYKNWGDTLVAEQKFGEAIAKYQQALALDPGNEEVKKNLQQAQDKSTNSSKSTPKK
jgi:tetratricopeptide (TPR) repeat protein